MAKSKALDSLDAYTLRYDLAEDDNTKRRHKQREETCRQLAEQNGNRSVHDDVAQQ